MSDAAELLVVRGNAFYAGGDIDAAIECYRSALEVQPMSARAHHNLGVALQELGRLDEAIAHYAKAVEAQPRSAKALVNWGNALGVLGDLAGARRLYARALEIDPRDAVSLNNLGSIAYGEGALDEAQAFYARSSALGNIDGWIGRGRVQRKRGALEDAAECFRAALAIDERHARAHYYLASVMHQLRQWSAAAEHYERAWKLQPGFVAALTGWAHTVTDANDREAAAPLYRRLLELDPSHAEALNNLGSFALDCGDMPTARALFERAVQAQPHLPEPRYNLALVALRQHDFEEGWRYYDLRMQADPETMGLRPMKLRRMAKADLPPEGPVAVRKEQGLGDQILFSTVLPDLRDAGVHAVVEADPRLLQTYRRAIPGIDFVPPELAQAAFSGCVGEIPLGSVPALFRRTLDDFAAQPRALLGADPLRVQQTRALLPQGRRIAIAWRTFQKGRHQFVSARKSAALEPFSAFEHAGVHLVDVQYGDVGEERREFDARHPGLRVAVPGLDLFQDVEGVLAAIEACDLVVTTSNVTAHFAGAIGKPTWLVYLGANAPFHYWVPGPDGHCLWYPSVEILTEERWTDWRDAFGAVAARLSGGP